LLVDRREVIDFLGFANNEQLSTNNEYTIMNYRITHTTIYSYSDPVSFCYNIARLGIRNTDNQFAHGSFVGIHPQPEVINEYEDFYGNKVIYFAIQHEHRTLTVIVSSEVTKEEVNMPAINLDNEMPWEVLREQLSQRNIELQDVKQFITDTPVTAANEDIRTYALQSFTSGRSVLEALRDLTKRIYEDFAFMPGFTTVATPASEVFYVRRGVCQDFAHLAIACIRSVGLPARYVSGYIETIPPPGYEKLVGIDASHAWFASYIPGIGWLDFDPTNNVIPSTQHVTIGWGRDYFDVAPLKGVILSSGSHHLSVSVDMKRI
jgi:transglutaminase-like putative cysteine protease